jgi:putative ABC transport system permease protein
LALGIGANTAIFTVIDSVLLKPLPYPEPDKLVNIRMRFTGIGIPDDRNFVSPPEFKDLERLNQSFSHVAAISGRSFSVSSGTGAPERVDGAAVSSSFFPMLDVRPHLGRLFTKDEETPGGDRAVLISHGLWQRRFGGDPKLVGQIKQRPVSGDRRPASRLRLSSRFGNVGAARVHAGESGAGGARQS